MNGFDHRTVKKAMLFQCMFIVQDLGMMIF